MTEGNMEVYKKVVKHQAHGTEAPPLARVNDWDPVHAWTHLIGNWEISCSGALTEWRTRPAT
ncbi:MAG: hypothetical protein AAGG01_23970, partial [Planctomycetota bacterium]